MTVYTPLPDDEAPDALLDTYADSLAASLTGWQRSDTSPEIAIGAAVADEISILYGLLRERADDYSRDFGANIEGIVPADAFPASSTVTLVASDSAGHTLPAGTLLALQDSSGTITIELVNDATILATHTTLTGAIVQATDGGANANGATGPISLDNPPSWLTSITLAAPLADGTDAETIASYDDTLARERRRSSKAVVLPEDVESVAQDIAGITRCLVLDNYDDDTGLDNQAKTLSAYPIDELGEISSTDAKTELLSTLQARREANFVFRVGDATYTTVDVAITVASDEPDTAAVQTTVTALVQAQLSPANHGQPSLGETRRWLKRSKVHLYQVSAAAARTDSVAYVDALTLNGVAADVTLAGPAALSRAGTITVTVIAPV